MDGTLERNHGLCTIVSQSKSQEGSLVHLKQTLNVDIMGKQKQRYVQVDRGMIQNFHYIVTH